METFYDDIKLLLQELNIKVGSIDKIDNEHLYQLLNSIKETKQSFQHGNYLAVLLLLRTNGEILCKEMLRRNKHSDDFHSHSNRLVFLYEQKYLNRSQFDLLEAIRTKGNLAVHESKAKSWEVIGLYHEFLELIEHFIENWGKSVVTHHVKEQKNTYISAVNYGSPLESKDLEKFRKVDKNMSSQLDQIKNPTKIEINKPAKTKPLSKKEKKELAKKYFKETQNAEQQQHVDRLPKWAKAVFLEMNSYLGKTLAICHQCSVVSAPELVPYSYGDGLMGEVSCSRCNQSTYGTFKIDKDGSYIEIWFSSFYENNQKSPTTFQVKYSKTLKMSKPSIDILNVMERDLKLLESQQKNYKQEYIALSNIIGTFKFELGYRVGESPLKYDFRDKDAIKRAISLVISGYKEELKKYAENPNSYFRESYLQRYVYSLRMMMYYEKLYSNELEFYHHSVKLLHTQYVDAQKYWKDDLYFFSLKKI